MRTGVDLGGTKIEAVVLDPSGQVRARARVPTPRGYDPVIKAICDVVAQVEGEAGAAAAVGVGIPGSLSPVTGMVRNANSTQLNGHPLDRDLATALGRPVRFDNDANCFALAEARSGAGQGAGVVFGVILGTGVGGGVVINGQARIGANGVAGEWGHNPLPAPRDDERPGPTCYCGRVGCIEAWMSGPSLARDHLRVTGQDIQAPAIAAAAAAGDAAAQGTLDRHRDRLARALGTVVNLLDPDVIVLGGGLSNLAGLAEALPQAMLPYVFTDRFVTPIRRHQLGDSAGVIGAAWLWPEGGA